MPRPATRRAPDAPSVPMPAACSIQCWEARNGRASVASAGPDAWIDLRAALWGASTSKRVMTTSNSASRLLSLAALGHALQDLVVDRAQEAG